VDSASAVIIPDIEAGRFASLAPVFCAGITVWDALKRAKLQINKTVAIVGAGGLGELAAQDAQAVGVTVIVIDIWRAQLQAAKANSSADKALSSSTVPAEEHPASVIALKKRRLVDVVIVTSRAIPTFLR
jgi:propanol-preferring alcohol dehydrogenase